jgi:Fe-S cluster assembly protein SufD
VADGVTTAGAAGGLETRETDRRIEAFLESLDEPEALLRRRREAWVRYAELPMPTRKAEEWRYTDLSALHPDDFQPFAPAADEEREVATADLPGPLASLLESMDARSAVAVRVDGRVMHRRLDPELSRQGVVFASLRQVARERPELLAERLYGSAVAPMEEKLWSLHAALLTGADVLYVPDGIRIAEPVHVLRWAGEGDRLLSTHTLLLTGRDSEVTWVEEYLSPELDRPLLSLSGLELFGGDGATIHYLALQRYGRGVSHFSIQHLLAGRDTRISGLNVNLGGDLARDDVTSHLEGPGCESEMLALWFGDDAQHFDHHTLQHHAAPHAYSDLLYKGALTDSASSVFRGLIRVDRGAQLTDAYQTNRNLLLSEDSHATTLPNLEIEADDVRCSHGATVGQVDENMLFYLMSRGLTRRHAERLLVFGFFDEVLGRVPVEGVRARLREAIGAKIGI